MRPEFFEKHGWRYVPLWTIDVFTDPGSVTERLATYLQLKAPTTPAVAKESSSRSSLTAARPVSAREVTTDEAPKEKSGLLKSAKSKLEPKAEAKVEAKSEDKSENKAQETDAKSPAEQVAPEAEPTTPAPVPASETAEQVESKK